MSASKYWLPIVITVAALTLPHGGDHAQARGAGASPPPQAPVVGGWVPTEFVREIDYVDDGGPNFQENLADDGAQSASGSGAPASAASGTVLASDSFSSSTSGILPTTSRRTSQWKVGYLNGEYQIASVGTGSDLDNTVLINGAYGDVTVAVDARVVQGTAAAPDQTVRLYCRWQAAGGGFTGYRLQYSPSDNKWGLYRGDGNSGVTLTGVQNFSGAASPATAHHLAMACSGSTITVSIDGVKLGSFQDGSYASGRAALGVGNFTLDDDWGIYPLHSAYPGTYDVRFSKLVLTQP